MECANKGVCDRTTGECTCYDGYDGVACQRASCPGFPDSCSGHGVCKSKKQLAYADHKNIYRLWDKNIGMGCECDHGYIGADCSLRTCKHGVDPLYLDDSATIKYSIFDFATLTTTSNVTNVTYFTDGTPTEGKGTWAIRFFDIFGEDWLTQPIEAGSNCSQVVAALEALPNNVVPIDTTYCTLESNNYSTASNKWSDIDTQSYSERHIRHISYDLSIWEAYTSSLYGELSPKTAITTSYNSSSGSDVDKMLLSGYIYRLKFYGVPGSIREPEIELYLDGSRPSLITTGEKVITKVWTDGQQGESNDYFADHCDSVSVTISWDVGLNRTYLTGLSSDEKALLKACLGDSDFDTSNNQEVYNWDYGSEDYPHIIKLVKSVTEYTDGGYYAALWFNNTIDLDSSGSAGTFCLLNPFFPSDLLDTDNYEVYTTKGTLAMTSNYAQAIFSFASKNIFMTNVGADADAGYAYGGDISCEKGLTNAAKFDYIQHCLNKTDMFTLLSWNQPEYNPPHINLYRATRLYTQEAEWSVKDRFSTKINNENNTLEFMTHIINSDLSTNWGNTIENTADFRVYKFFPSTASTYKVVDECSSRGLCDRDTGLCQCFPGYTNDECSVQSSIAL